MDIKLLKSCIFSNTIPNFLVFFVEESALYRQYLNSISNTLNKDYEIYDTAREAIYDIESNIKDDHIYLIFDDTKISGEELSKLLDSGKNIILCYNDISSSQKLHGVLSKYSSNVVEFRKIDRDTLLAYAIKLCKNNKCSVDTDILIKLIDCCDCDLGIMINELNKIFLLEQSNSNLLVNYLINEGFIDYRDISLDRFVNSVISRDYDSFVVGQKIEDSPVTVLTAVYNSALNKLKSTRAVQYSKLMGLCFNIQKGILDGTIDSKYAIRYLLLRWFS